MTGDAAPMLTDGEIENVVDRYRDAMIRYEEAAIAVENRVRRELRAASVHALLSSRAKHPDEVRHKLRRRRSGSTPPASVELTGNLDTTLTDLAGVRVIVYHTAEEQRVFAMLQQKLSVVPGSPDLKRSATRPYRASHLLVELDESFERESIRGTVVEIQIASIASHVFNEIEHDIGYKDHGVPATDAVRSGLDEVFHATRLLDSIVARLLDERVASVEHNRLLIPSAEQLRHALERRTQHALTGDFVRLFRLLDAAISPLTVAALERLGNPAVVIDRGFERSRDHGGAPIEDATAYALGLMPELGQNFKDHASTWRGRRQS